MKNLLNYPWDTSTYVKLSRLKNWKRIRRRRRDADQLAKVALVVIAAIAIYDILEEGE